jgi:hypothetical protein
VSQKSFFIGAGALAFASSLALAAPAQATVMQAVFRGTIAFDDEGTGADLVGLQQNQLVGQAFTMTFRYDTTLGTLNLAGDSRFRDGGPVGFKTPSPVSSAQVEINGKTFVDPSLGFGSVGVVTDTLGRTLSFCVEGADGGGAHQERSPVMEACLALTGAPLSLDLSQPFAVDGNEDASPATIRLLKVGPNGFDPSDELQVEAYATSVVVTRVDAPTAPPPAAPAGRR